MYRSIRYIEPFSHIQQLYAIYPVNAPMLRCSTWDCCGAPSLQQLTLRSKT